MSFRVLACTAMTTVSLLATGVGLAQADAEKSSPKETPTSEQARKAVERGLDFVEKDAAKWRADRQCSTCHHGTMTVWALSEAKSRGYAVTAETLADMTKWTKDRLLERIDLPRDKRPGWSMVNTPAIYLSLMALTVPKQEAVSADELKRIAGHLLRHQEADGSWAWSSAPAENRPPPFFESDEVATLLAYVALSPQVPTDPKEKSEIRDSHEKAAAWLAKSTPTDTTQAIAFRCSAMCAPSKPAREVQAGIDSSARPPEQGRRLGPGEGCGE